MRRVYDRDDLRPGDAIAGPAVIRERNATTVVEPGWRATLTARDHLVLDRDRSRAARARDRHDRRPGAARSVQQPVHGDRRADGRDARQHRLLGQHQGAARLFLRDLRRRRQPDRQRAAHAGAPGLDGRVRDHDHRPPRGNDAARRRVRAERALQRRHAPAGRDGDRAGVPGRRRRPSSIVASRGHHADIGGITPGSMPPDSTHVDEEGVLLDNVQLVAGGRFLEAEMRAILASGRYPSRNVDQNLADLRAQVAACAKGASELAKMVAHFASAGRSRVHAARAGQRRGVGAPRPRCAEGRPLRIRDGQRREDRRSRSRSTRRKREATIDFTGTSAQQPTQLQRAVRRVQGGGALRVPHAGRRRDPDERRLPEAVAHRHSRRLDAASALSGGRRRRQRRDVADGHRCAVRRAGRARRVAGDDEQLHVRQRHAISITRRSPAARARARISTARASCRRT